MSAEDDLRAEVGAEQQAQVAPEHKSSFGEDLVALENGVVGAIPGGKWLSAKIAGALPGGNEQEAAQLQQDLETNHPGKTMVGSVAGAIGGAMLAPEAAALKGMGALGKAAVSAGQAAVLTPAYKLGDTANQAQVQSTPLRIEQVGHALIPDWDSLKAAGLALLFHAPGIAVDGLQGLQNGVGRVSESSAGKFFKGASRDIAKETGANYEPAALGRKALDEGLLSDSSKIDVLKDKADAIALDAAASTPVDRVARNAMAGALDRVAKGAESNTILEPAMKLVSKQARALEEGQAGGQEVQGIIQSLADKSRATKDPQTKQFYADSAQVLRQYFTKHITSVDQARGETYIDAVRNSDVYAHMVKGAEIGEAVQATGLDLAKKVGKTAVGATVGGAFGGGAAGELVGAVLGSVLKIPGSPNKSYAVLMDKFSKNPPLANFLRHADGVVDHLMGSPSPFLAAKYAANQSQASADDRYAEVTHAVRSSVGRMDDMATELGTKLDFLPQHEKDGIVANTMNKLQDAAAQIPANDQPATAFGVQTGPSDREKRDYLNKFDAKFDPYKAIMSGNQDLIKEADRFNPELMQEIRKKLIDRCAETNVPYSTKRQIAAILGVAGVPTQDPMLGAKLQNCIVTARQANSHQGQMDSARQQGAMMKNNQATLTRANSISNSLNEK